MTMVMHDQIDAHEADEAEEAQGAPAAITGLGTRLRQVIDESGLSMSEVARRAGTTQATISKIVGNKISVSRYVYAIARVLGVDPLWLATGIRGSGAATQASQLNRALMRRVIVYGLPILQSDKMTPEEIADTLLQLHDHWAILDSDDSASEGGSESAPEPGLGRADRE